MSRKPKPQKVRYTLRKLIDYALSQLCPGGTWKPPEKRKGRMEVEVELPADSVDIQKPTR